MSGETGYNKSCLTTYYLGNIPKTVQAFGLLVFVPKRFTFLGTSIIYELRHGIFAVQSAPRVTPCLISEVELLYLPSGRLHA
jgi:hypothetical protein